MILDWYNKVSYKAAAASQFVIMYGGKAGLILAPRSIALCFCTFYLYFKNILQPDFFKYIKNCKSCVMCVKTVPWGFHAELRLTQVVDWQFKNENKLCICSVQASIYPNCSDLILMQMHILIFPTSCCYVINICIKPWGNSYLNQSVCNHRKLWCQCWQKKEKQIASICAVLLDC